MRYTCPFMWGHRRGYSLHLRKLSGLMGGHRSGPLRIPSLTGETASAFGGLLPDRKLTAPGGGGSRHPLGTAPRVQPQGGSCRNDPAESRGERAAPGGDGHVFPPGVTQKVGADPPQTPPSAAEQFRPCELTSNAQRLPTELGWG